MVPIHPTCRLFATQWFLTLFGRFLTLFGRSSQHLGLRVMDVFLLDGWAAVLRVAVALLQHGAPVLMKLNVEMQHGLPESAMANDVAIQRLLAAAAKLPITAAELTDLEGSFRRRPKLTRTAWTPLACCQCDGRRCPPPCRSRSWVAWTALPRCGVGH